jgi:hypothetical protein
LVCEVRFTADRGTICGIRFSLGCLASDRPGLRMHEPIDKQAPARGNAVPREDAFAPSYVRRLAQIVAGRC